MLVLQAFAQPPDLSGTWVLDAEASESMAPILAAQGVPWIARKVAEDLDTPHAIQQDATSLTITFDNLAGSHVQVLRFDGQPHTTVNPAGLATTFASSWSDGQLRSEGPVLDGGEQVATLVEVRTLTADGDTLHLDVTLTGVDGTSRTARRVFTRQP